MTRILLAGLGLLSLAACTVNTPGVTMGAAPPPAPAPAPVIVQQPAPSVVVR